MSRTRAYSQDTLDIQKRYFDIMQELVDAKKIPGSLAGFCEVYGIDRRHWYAQRADNGRGYFEVSWLVPNQVFWRLRKLADARHGKKIQEMKILPRAVYRVSSFLCLFLFFWKRINRGVWGGKKRETFSFLFYFFSFKITRKAIALFAFVLYDAECQHHRPSKKAIAFMKKPIAFSGVMKSNWFLLIYMMQISSIIRRSEKQLLYLLFSSSVSLAPSSG